MRRTSSLRALLCQQVLAEELGGRPPPSGPSHFFPVPQGLLYPSSLHPSEIPAELRAHQGIYFSDTHRALE